MTYVLPLPLPASLVAEQRIIPKNDFSHAHLGVSFSADGRAFVTSDLFYNYTRYNAGDGDYRALLVTELSPSFDLTRVVVLSELAHRLTHVVRDGVAHYDFGSDLRAAVALPDGALVFGNAKDRTVVLDPTLGRELLRMDPLEGGARGVSDLAPLPSGALFALRARNELCVGVTAQDLVATVGALRPVATALGEGSLAAASGFAAYRAYVGDLSALDDDRAVLSFFSVMSRGGYLDRSAFRYLVVDREGKTVAALPLGEADSPYLGRGEGTFACVAHRKSRSLITRSEHALHVFDRDGAPRLRFPIKDDESHAALRPLHLFGAAPGGELLFVHRKHHTLVVTDPFDDARALPEALEHVAASYKSALARLKKAVPVEGGRFLGFEARSTPATAVPAKAPKPKKVAAPSPSEPVPAAPAQPAGSPEEAVAFAPTDAAVAAVYADWLGQRGDTLGEYLSTALALEALAPETDRAELERAMARQWQAHGRGWLARWNTPIAIVSESTPRTFGLPNHAKVAEVPSSVERLDEQLGRLPLRSLRLEDLGSRDVAKVLTGITPRGLGSLSISGDSKHKLTGVAIKPLLAQVWPALRSLTLSRVELSARDARALLEQQTELSVFGLFQCGITSDKVAELGASPAATRLRELWLSSNPLGSEVLRHLGAFAALTRLSLASTGLTDTLPADLSAELSVEALDLGSNAAAGEVVAWLVDHAPRLRELTLPTQLRPLAIDAIRRAAPRLERVEMSYANPESRRDLLTRALADAQSLTRLDMGGGDGGGLLARAIALPSLVELTLGGVEDADVVELAARGHGRIESLRLEGPVSDRAARTLGASSKLPALKSLTVSSRALTASGVASLVGLAREELGAWYATIDDALPLLDAPLHGRLTLLHCNMTRAARSKLEARWGGRLRAS